MGQNMKKRNLKRPSSSASNFLAPVEDDVSEPNITEGTFIFLLNLNLVL